MHVTRYPQDHRKIDCDISDLQGSEAEAVASLAAPVLSVEALEREQIEEALAGLPITVAQIENLSRLIDRLAIVRAAETLRHVIRSLGNTPAGRALERALLGSDGHSLADDSKDVRCTRQNLHFHERNCVARLAHLTTGAIKKDPT